MNLLKPPELSSHDAVALVRRLCGGARVGHGGTLDPDAAGVLPIAVGRALGLLGRVDWGPKGYVGAAAFGRGTDSLDAAGAVVSSSHPPWPGRQDLERTARFLLGRGRQVPPRRSSIRQGGVHAYERARRGEVFFLPPRTVEIRMLTVEQVRGPAFEFATEVSSGTYVRALVRDWAEMLGHAAHLGALVRTRAGPFRVEEAVSVEELSEEGVAAHLLSWRRVWDGPVADLGPHDAELVYRGRWPAGVTVLDPGVVALAAGERLAALGEAPNRFLRVFPGGLY